MPRLSYYFRDEIFTGIDERAIEFESSTIHSLHLVNARLSWLPQEDFRLSAYVDNLLDEGYFASSSSATRARERRCAAGDHDCATVWARMRRSVHRLHCSRYSSSSATLAGNSLSR